MVYGSPRLAPDHTIAASAMAPLMTAGLLIGGRWLYRWRVFSCPPLVFRDDERAPPWPGPDQSFLSEDRDGPPHGVAGEPVVLHQVGERRKRATRPQLARRDLLPKDRGELREGRSLRLMINAHAIKVTDQALPG